MDENDKRFPLPCIRNAISKKLGSRGFLPVPSFLLILPIQPFQVRPMEPGLFSTDEFVCRLAMKS